MPKTAQEELTGRRLADPRDTFDYTTPNLNVSARPVDAFVTPGSSSVLNQLVSALSEVNPALSSIGNIMEDVNDRRREKGGYSALKGEAPPPKSKGWAFIEGYEELDGKLKGSLDYKLEIQNLINTQGHLPPAEFKKELDKVRTKYTAGASDYFLKGFKDTSLAVDSYVEEAYTQSQFNRVKDDFVDKLRTNMTITTGEKINSLLKTRFGVQSLQQLKDNPALLQKVKNDPAWRQELSNSLRQALSENQALVKDLPIGLTKDDVTARFVDVIGTIAVEYGLPELMDFTDTNDSGFVISGSEKYKEMVTDFKKRAEVASSSVMKAALVQEKENQEKAITAESNRVDTRIGEIERVTNRQDRLTQANEALDYLRKNKLLTENIDTGGMTDRLNKIIKEATEGKTGRPTDNDNVEYWRLKDLASMGLLKMSDVKKSDLNNLLTDSQQSELVNDAEYLENIRRKKEEAKDTTSDWPDRTVVNEYRKSLINQLAGATKWGGFDKPENIAVATRAFTTALESWKKSHSGVYPTWDQYTKEIADPTFEKLNKQMNPPPKSEPKTATADEGKNKTIIGQLADKAANVLFGDEDKDNKPKSTPQAPTPAKTTSTPKPTPVDDGGKDDDDVIYKSVQDAFTSGYSRQKLEEYLKGKSAHYLTTYGKMKTRDLIKAKTSEPEIKKKLKGWGYKDNEIEFYIKWAKENPSK